MSDEWTDADDVVEEVRQISDTQLHWVAKIAGAKREWDAEIIDQEPDQRIAWRSLDGAGNGGIVIANGDGDREPAPSRGAASGWGGARPTSPSDGTAG